MKNEQVTEDFKWTVIYRDEYGRKKETIIKADDYELAITRFEYDYPNCKAIIFQKH